MRSLIRLRILLVDTGKMIFQVLLSVIFVADFKSNVIKYFIQEKISGVSHFLGPAEEAC